MEKKAVTLYSWAAGAPPFFSLPGYCVTLVASLKPGGMVTLLRDQTAVTGQALFEAPAWAGHPRK